MPKMPFDPAQGFKQVLSSLLVMVFEPLRELAEKRDVHGEMEPVEDMLAGRRDHLGEQADFFAAIPDEGDILVGLNALLLEIVEDVPLRLAIIAVDEIDTAGTTIFGERAADDEFEVLLPVVAVANIAAIQANDDAALGSGQVNPVTRAGILHEGHQLFRQFSLNTTVIDRPHRGSQSMKRDVETCKLSYNEIAQLSAC